MNQGQFDTALNDLTSRRKEVLLKLLAGDTDKAIAQCLQIEVSTVRKHIQEICNTFGLKNQPGEHYSQRPDLIDLFTKFKPDLVKQRSLCITSGADAVETSEEEDSSNIYSYQDFLSQPDPNFVERENAIANLTQDEEATDNPLEAQVQEKIKRNLEEQANISQERLFGVEKYLIELREYLRDKEGSWFISVVGTGGVGKTSIVEKLVRENTLDSGFIDLAWVTAKRNYLRPEDRSIRNTGFPLNIDGLVSDIAEQLQISLPPIVSEHFSYLKSQLKAAPYLIIIDNLETLEDYRELLEEFHADNKKIQPSKIIFTSRQKIQKLNFEVREKEIKGIDLTPTLELIRYKGGHVQRIAEASDEELLPIFKATNGIPLLILLVVSLIATDDSPLEEVIMSLFKQDKLYKYLYEEALSLISDNAFKVLTSISLPGFSESSPIPRRQLIKQTELSDEEFKVAVGECIERSLLTSISKSLSDEPRYSIHNLLYAFLRESEASD
jgi:DNA-binding CsgD family transcriptional regulator/GTPase SAR1 family protein